MHVPAQDVDFGMRFHIFVLGLQTVCNHHVICIHTSDIFADSIVVQQVQGGDIVVKVADEPDSSVRVGTDDVHRIICGTVVYDKQFIVGECLGQDAVQAVA